VIDVLLGRLDQAGPPGATSQDGPAAVGGDPEQPGAERPASVEARDASEGAEEYLLHHVLGIVLVAHHAEAEAENDPLVPLDQQTRRLRVAGPEFLDQRAVVHRHHVLPAVRAPVIDLANRGYLLPRPAISRFPRETVSPLRNSGLKPFVGSAAPERCFLERVIRVGVIPDRGGRWPKETMTCHKAKTWAIHDNDVPVQLGGSVDSSWIELSS
jgi:hypothetical protein